MRARLIEAAAFDVGIRALLRETGPDGVFCYIVLRAVGLRCYCDDHRIDKETAR